MNRVVAKFEKVSYEQFKEDWIKTMLCDYDKIYGDKEKNDKIIRAIYDSIKLPQRATSGSAGYDIFAPIDFTVEKNHTINIPTGIRCRINSGWVLTAYPRSGHGFKYGIKLANTVGIIDSDYYNAKNEGHIFVKLVNESVLNKSEFSVAAGSAFCQGIFIPYGITENDEAKGERTGGFGSTDAN